MTPEEYEAHAARFRLQALRAEMLAATLNTGASIALLGASMTRFIAALRASEARDIAEHPDLAELNLQLDGYYGGG